MQESLGADGIDAYNGFKRSQVVYALTGVDDPLTK